MVLQDGELVGSFLLDSFSMLGEELRKRRRFEIRFHDYNIGKPR